MAGTDLKQQLGGFAKNRLEALIDGIFSVALTLLVLDIKLPENESYATNQDLWNRLLELERHFAIYVISFIAIAIYWIGHHLQFHFVRYTDRRLIWINMFYLLMISFLPFATDMVGDHEDLVLPCEIYGLTMLTLSATSLVHLRYLVRHPHLTNDSMTPLAVKLLKRRILLFTALPVLSMILAFYSTRLALYIYLLFALAHFIPTHIDDHIYAAPADDEPDDESKPA